MRSEQITQLRPTIAADSTNTLPVEQFQNEVIRPILKFQNEVLLYSVKTYTLKYQKNFPLLNQKEQHKLLKQVIQDNAVFKNILVTMVVALFTKNELEFYFEHKGELARRITQLIYKRITDQIEQLL